MFAHSGKIDENQDSGEKFRNRNTDLFQIQITARRWRGWWELLLLGPWPPVF